MGLTEQVDRDVLATILVNAWSDVLGLEDWDIRYDPAVETDSNCQANIDFRTMEKVATISLDRRLPLDSFEPSIIHELLHLVVKRYVLIVHNLIAQTPEPLQAFVANQVEAEEEAMIEQITRAFGMPRFIPYGDLLPAWQAFAPEPELEPEAKPRYAFVVHDHKGPH